MKHNKIMTIFILCLIVISVGIALINLTKSKNIKMNFLPHSQKIMFLAILLIPISRIFLTD